MDAVPTRDCPDEAVREIPGQRWQRDQEGPYCEQGGNDQERYARQESSAGRFLCGSGINYQRE
eukprot:1196305-Rhodomonas_salina.1